MRGWPAVLDWLARIRVAGIEPMAYGLGITPRQVHTHARFLEAEKLAVRSRLYDGGGAVLAITPRGVREAGYDITTTTRTTSFQGLLHGRGVSWIAAHCERAGRPWIGPEELRWGGWITQISPTPGVTARTHMPDLGLILDGSERWAVEFERVTKARVRLRAILSSYRTAQLTEQLDEVLYVCDNDMIIRQVESVAAEVGFNPVVRTLDQMIAEARRDVERKRSASSASRTSGRKA
jgi:hypothetical protein